VFRLGLARQLGRLEEMVRNSPMAEMDLLDGDSLCLALHQTAAGVGEMTAANRLNSALALVAWYDHLGPALRRPADRPSEALALSSAVRKHANTRPSSAGRPETERPGTAPVVVRSSRERNGTGVRNSATDKAAMAI